MPTRGEVLDALRLFFTTEEIEGRGNSGRPLFRLDKVEAMAAAFVKMRTARDSAHEKLAAARTFAKWKQTAKQEWIDHGVVSASTGVSLDKATDDLLTTMAAEETA